MKLKLRRQNFIAPLCLSFTARILSEACYLQVNRGILVYNICLISISNSDGATNKSVLNIERSY